MNDPIVKNQYSTPDKLNTRISIHKKYSVNKQGVGSWIFSNYHVEDGMKVLEKNMHDGVLHVPKDYGMFIARKNVSA